MSLAMTPILSYASGMNGIMLVMAGKWKKSEKKMSVARPVERKDSNAAAPCLASSLLGFLNEPVWIPKAHWLMVSRDKAESR